MKIASIYVPKTALMLVIMDSVLIVLAHLMFLQLFGFETKSSFPPVLIEMGHLLVFAGSALITLFAFGLYQRRYLKSKTAWRSIVSSYFSFSIIYFLATGLIFSNWIAEPSTIFFFGMLFAIFGFMRPVACFFSETFFTKRRVAFVAPTGVLNLMDSAAARVSPSDFEVVDKVSIANGDSEALNAAVSQLYAQKNIDEVIVGQSNEVQIESAVLAQLRKNYSSLLFTSNFTLYERCSRWTETTDFDEDTLTKNTYYRSFWMKRIFDTTIAFALLLFFLPIIVLTILAIKLEDQGSILYRQQRVGKGGKVFSVLKFRSMVENAEGSSGAVWASKQDNRVTKVGSFIRLTRIDEIPQLINIFTGDMALVGPRPERPEITAKLDEHIEGYNLRHLVRPGVTGWAQINYPYGASIEDARWKTRFDMYYLKNWSIWLDLAIVLQTVRVVLLQEGSR